MKIKFINKIENTLKVKVVLLTAFLFLLISGMSACGIVGSSLKPSKTSLLTIEAEIPDKGMALSELNKDAISVLGKTDLNKPVQFKYQKFLGNNVIIFKDISVTKVNPSKIESSKNGYKASYSINHTDIQLKKIEKRELVRVIAKGSSISEAIETGIKNAMNAKVGEGKDVNISGSLNIVNIFSVKYSPKDVSVDFSITFTFKSEGVLSKADKADFYAEIGVADFYRKKYDKSANMARKGLDLYKDCDRCYYLKGLLNYHNQVYERAVYYYEKAFNLNGDVLYYCQRLLSSYNKYYEIINGAIPKGQEKKKEIQTKAFELSAYISKHFNADGTVYKKTLPPISSKTLDFSLPTVKNQTLKNGLILTELVKNELPLFTLSLAFNFGTVNNPKGKMGMIDTTLELLKDGVEGMDSSKLAMFMDQNGLNLSNVVSKDYSKIQCSSLTENAGKCVELLDLLVKKASFPDREYKKYMKQRVEYYHASTASASYLANKLLYRLVFGKHNYGYYDATLKTLSSIKIEDIKSFYKDYFNPKNAYIVVSGKYDEKVLNNIKSKFSDWKEGKLTEVAKENRIKASTEKRSFIYVIDRPSSKQVVISYGQSTLPYKSKNFLSLYMANKVLGGTSSSRLFMRLREKESLTYGAYSSMSANLESGLFQASLSVRNNVVGKAVRSLLDELKTFKELGVTEQELKDKKGLEYGSFAMRLQGFGYAHLLVASKFLSLPVDYYKNYLSNLAKLRVKDINDSANKFIMPDNGVIVIVGDSKSFKDQLKPFGSIAIFDENLKPKK